MDNSTPETAPAITVNDILTKYERECVPKLAPRTQYYYRLHIQVLLAAFGTRIAEELQPKDFAGFLEVGREHGLVLRTKQLAVLSSAFTQAVRFWYWLPRNVLRDVHRPRFKARDRLVSDEEFEACKAMAPKRVQLGMMLALLTGQREGDIIAFRWDAIKDVPVEDADGNKKLVPALHVQQGKTGKRLAIRITPRLETVLDECWLLPGGGKDGSKYVLPKHNGQPYKVEGFRSKWNLVMRKWERMGNENFHFHDLRALAATKCKTPESARQLLGHANISMTLKAYRRGIEQVDALVL